MHLLGRGRYGTILDARIGAIGWQESTMSIPLQLQKSFGDFSITSEILLQSEIKPLIICLKKV
jgi:hypothetical protein